MRKEISRRTFISAGALTLAALAARGSSPQISAEQAPTTTPILDKKVYLPRIERQIGLKNLIKNPSFEEVGPDALPVGWVRGGEVSLASYSSSESHSGLRSVSVETVAVADEVGGIITKSGIWTTKDRLPIEPADPSNIYKLLFLSKIKRSTEITFVPTCQVRGYYQNGVKSLEVRSGTVSRPGSPPEWHEFFAAIFCQDRTKCTYTFPAGTVSVEIDLMVMMPWGTTITTLGSLGTVYFDALYFGLA